MKKEKGKERGCLLRTEIGPTLSNYRQDWDSLGDCSTAQTSGDLRFAPVSEQGSGILSEPSICCGTLRPSQPTGSAYQRASRASAHTWLAFGLARTPLSHFVQIGPAPKPGLKIAQVSERTAM